MARRSLIAVPSSGRQSATKASPLSSRVKSAQTRVPARRNAGSLSPSCPSRKASPSALRIAPGSISARSGAMRAPRRSCQCANNSRLAACFIAIAVSFRGRKRPNVPARDISGDSVPSFSCHCFPVSPGNVHSVGSFPFPLCSVGFRPILPICLPGADRNGDDMRTKLTQAFAEKATARPGAERTFYWDQTMPGFGLMVTDAGARSFVVQYRADGVSRRMKLGNNLTVDEARKLARKRLSEVDQGHDPLKEKRKKQEAAKNSLRSIVEEYQRREGGRLRTAEWRMAALERHVLPTLGGKHIEEIKRSDIVRLLDNVEDRGPVMADKVLGILSRIFNWHAARSDDFRSPIIRGMARTKISERARDRILSDAEIRAAWRATEAPTGPFPALVRFLLLTAARRSEAAEMRWGELVGKDWILPGARNKTGLELVRPLSDAARAVLTGLPKIGRGEFVFSTGRGRPFADFNSAKKPFDAACGVTRWTLHDLRRTARSLMSRAGVPTDHAERCLGHVIGGVRGTYDRHAYHEEKRRAFEALAAQIGRIVNPQENVVLIGRSSS